MKAFSPPMLQAARSLLINQQGGDLAQMKMSDTLDSGCKTQAAVVMHTIAVLFSNSKLQLLMPFINILDNPASLTVRIIGYSDDGVSGRLTVMTLCDISCPEVKHQYNYRLTKS
jgi:hypothetical protein